MGQLCSNALAYIAYRSSYQEFAPTGSGEVSHCFIFKAISILWSFLFYVYFLLCYEFNQYVCENLRRLAGVLSLVIFFFFFHDKYSNTLVQVLLYLISWFGFKAIHKTWIRISEVTFSLASVLECCVKVLKIPNLNSPKDFQKYLSIQSFWTGNILVRTCKICCLIFVDFPNLWISLQFLSILPLWFSTFLFFGIGSS